MIKLFFMRKTTLTIILSGLAGLALLGGLAWAIPSIQSRIAWRAETALTYVRAVLNPAGALPTSLPQPRVAITRQPTETPAAPLETPEQTQQAALAPTRGPTPTATPLPTPIPSVVSLVPPKWEKQDANNCGPASLALYLRHYGWEGDQFTISQEIKPFREDRNVNVEELAYYARNNAGWLKFEYRVGGNLELLKRVLAAGIPIMIESGTQLDQSYWPNDDQWAAHYLLLTGYDDSLQIFTGQDTYFGADKKFPYPKLDEAWQAFNRVYILLYPPEKEAVIQSILGPQWDVEYNRQYALQVAQEETLTEPGDAFAWFNLGTNLVYFDRHADAVTAYDQARSLGLPQRMLRYQFGPFLAYFNALRTEDLLALTDYALDRTANSEEALLWRGWALYRQGNKAEALSSFQQALEAHPGYHDAIYAIEYVQSN